MWRVLGYSREKLPTLNEVGGLDEPSEIGGPVGLVAVYDVGGNKAPVLANGTINWFWLDKPNQFNGNFIKAEMVTFAPHINFWQHIHFRHTAVKNDFAGLMKSDDVRSSIF